MRLTGWKASKPLQSNQQPRDQPDYVEFELDRDLDVAAQDVRKSGQSGAGELPDAVENPVIQKEGGGGVAAIIWFAPLWRKFHYPGAERLRRHRADGPAGVCVGGEPDPDWG